MAFDEFIDNRLELRAVLAKSPGDLTTGSHRNFGVDPDLIENLGLELGFVAVHDDHRNQAGINQFQ